MKQLGGFRADAGNNVQKGLPEGDAHISDKHMNHERVQVFVIARVDDYGGVGAIRRCC